MRYTGINFGGYNSSSLSGILSNYNSIRSGSYGRMLKTYYGKQNTSTAKANANAFGLSANALTRTNTQLTNLKAESNDLKNAANKLLDNGKNSVWNKKEVKPEDGTVSREYDVDAIYRSISTFAREYNSTLSAVSGTSGSAVQNAARSMTSTTNIVSKRLSSVGINVGTDGKLSIDEETFKKSNMDTVKGLFQGSTSYAGIISSAASRINTASGSQLSSLNNSFYGRNGLYGSSYSQLGSLFNAYF
ncbi:MAG: hypothetical protein IJ567_09760 [Lachnospiraceae bacterium]|nr:hypothetical protein [Lachnospiraceae bacterium]